MRRAGRQKKISLLAQAFIDGAKPPRPDTFSAAYSGGTLTLNMANAGRTWKFLKHDILPADGTTSTAGMLDEKVTFDAAKWQDGSLTPGQ